jgi:hypothetical protein
MIVEATAPVEDKTLSFIYHLGSFDHTGQIPASLYFPSWPLEGFQAIFLLGVSRCCLLFRECILSLIPAQQWRSQLSVSNSKALADPSLPSRLPHVATLASAVLSQPNAISFLARPEAELPQMNVGHTILSALTHSALWALCAS